MDISLSSLNKEDLELVRNWRNSPEVAKYMYTDNYITQQQQQDWFNKINSDSSKQYWIIKYDNKKVGVASLTDINTLFSSCYWAFYLGDSSIRGAGIGSKVEYNILEYVFEELQLNKLRCEVLAINNKVVQMHEKFGFRREAFYRQHFKKNEAFHDVIGLAILNRDWKFIRPMIKQKIYANDKQEATK